MVLRRWNALKLRDWDDDGDAVCEEWNLAGSPISAVNLTKTLMLIGPSVSS